MARSFKQTLSACCLCVGLGLACPGYTLANNQSTHNYVGPGNDDDTILIEDEIHYKKIPYHRILKSIAKKLFTIDTDNALSFGSGKKDSIVRSLRDLTDRMKCRVRLEEEEVALKLTINL